MLTGRPFRKGVSGNPGGRPAVPIDVVKLAQAKSTLAINTLAEVCQNKKANAGARVMAASVLLDRAWGKAIQRSETKSLNVNLSELTDGQLLAMLQELHPGAALPAPLEDIQSSSLDEESQGNGGVIDAVANLSHETSHETPKRRAKKPAPAKGLSSKEVKVLRASRRRVPSPLPPGASESIDGGGDGDGSPP